MERTNADRAERARRAVVAYQGHEPDRLNQGEDAAIEVLSDLLGDLKHLCDQFGVSYEEADTRGYRAYLAEVAEERAPSEQEAVRLLKIGHLPAELIYTGGRIAVAELRGEYGAYVWVTEAEGQPVEDGEPFMVCGYTSPDDEPDPTFSSAAELVENVEFQLRVAESVAKSLARRARQ